MDGGRYPHIPTDFLDGRQHTQLRRIHVDK
jgi:hypothetical protein